MGNKSCVLKREDFRNYSNTIQVDGVRVCAKCKKSFQEHPYGDDETDRRVRELPRDNVVVVNMLGRLDDRANRYIEYQIDDTPNNSYYQDSRCYRMKNNSYAQNHPSTFSEKFVNLFSLK